jgi:murein DD-endopeptidase MepM/ murein hydrolase activator NlpD
MSLLALWFRVSLTAFAEDAAIPRDVAIPSAITTAAGSETTPFVGGAWTEKKGASITSPATSWPAYEAPICTKEDLPVPYPVRFFFGHHPNYFGGRWHGGVDMPCPVGTPVRTTMGGIVSFAGESKAGYGILVVVQNGAYQTYYAHASELAVSPGDVVEAGQVVALSGNTGFSTGPHLHYEVRVNGRPVNPLTVRWSHQLDPACAQAGDEDCLTVFPHKQRRQAWTQCRE